MRLPEFTTYVAGKASGVTFTDLVILPYLIVFVRQYFWTIEQNIAAWILTVVVTAVLWLFFLRLKEPDEQRVGRRFWMIVGLPLLLVFALRVAFPDTSYDVLNYRIVGAERALRGWPFISGDFFPPFYPLNSAPDMLLGIFRHLLGYRLGTIFNLFTLLATAVWVYKLLEPYIPNRTLINFVVLAVVWTEHALFLVNNYMVDLLALPLQLEATWLSLQSTRQNSSKRLWRFALLLGITVALKPLNLAYALPLIAIYLMTMFSERKSLRLRSLLTSGPVAVGVFLLPLAPYTLYIYRETGNPVFPLYNAIFKSPFWPLANLYDERWGAQTWLETLVWPVRVAFDTSRTGELAVNSGRLSLAVIAAVFALVALRRDRRLRALSVATLLGAFLWSAALTGYSRYSVLVEFIGGITLVCVISRILLTWKANSLWQNYTRATFAAILSLGLIVQLARASYYVTQYEWSMRPTVFDKPRVYWAEAALILGDYRLEKFMDDVDRSRLSSVGAWIESGPLASGFYALLAPDKPILCAFVPDYFYSPEGREKFNQALRQSAGKSLGTLCHENDLTTCTKFAQARGLEVVEHLPVTIPVYSRQTQIRMHLMTLRLSEPNK